jgi:hypothetical protein
MPDRQQLSAIQARYDAICKLAKQHPQISEGIAMPEWVRTATPARRLEWVANKMELRAADLGLLKEERNG